MRNHRGKKKPTAKAIGCVNPMNEREIIAWGIYFLFSKALKRKPQKITRNNIERLCANSPENTLRRLPPNAK